MMSVEQHRLDMKPGNRYRIYVKMPFFLCLFTLLGMSTETVYGQNYRFRNFTSENGLSQNSINDICQDQLGYIWIGTQDGLNLYDGNSFEHFRFTGKTGPVQDNFITKIVDDGLGNLILGHRKGITVFSKKEKTGYLLRPIDSIGYQPVRNIQNINGTIWILDVRSDPYTLTRNERGLYTLTKSTGLNTNQTLFSLHNIENRPAAIVRKGIVTDLNSGSFIPFPNQDSVISKLVDFSCKKGPNGTYYFTTNFKLYEYQPNSTNASALREIPFRPNDGQKSSVKLLDLAFDHSGQLWIASEDGVYILKGDSLVHHEQLKSIKQEETGNLLVQDVFQDRQHQMWVGTASKGILLYNPEQERFRFLNDRHGLEDPTIWSIEQDGNKLLLGTSSGLTVVTLDNGNLRDQTFLEKKVQSIHTCPVVKNERIMAIRKINNFYWLGTTRGITILDTDLKTVVRDYSYSDLGLNTSTLFDDIEVITVKGEKIVLISSFYGIFRFRLSGDMIGPLEDIGQVYILDMMVQDHLLWVGGNDGLWKYDAESSKLTKYSYIDSDTTGKSTSFRFVSSIAEDNINDVLWLGTYGGGINTFDPKTETFKWIGEEEGLSNNVISAVAVSDSIVWAAHNKGISACHIPTGKIYNYSKSEGVVFNEFAVNSVKHTDENMMLFGSVNGISVIDGNDFALDKAPEVFPFIDRIEVNYGKSDPKKVMDQSSGKLSLKPSQKVLKLDLVIPDLAHEGTFIQYRITGNDYDSTWRKIEPFSNQITLSNLPYGSYVLQARLVNRHGQISSKRLTIPMEVIPPLWRRWWFILLIIFSVSGLIVLVSRYFARRKLKVQLIRSEAEKRLLYEKQRISKDLHDNVGANITYLIHSLDNIAFKLERNERSVPSEEVDALSNEARGTMDSLRETIWAVSKDQVTLQDFKNRFDQYASKMLTVANIKYKPRFDFDPDTRLSPFLAINILRVMQEAVNNAVKHSKAEKLELDFSYQTQSNGSDVPNGSGKLKVIIKDNGKGFDMKDGKAGHFGLNNMQDRITELGGTCAISSQPGKGTELVIEV